MIKEILIVGTVLRLIFIAVYLVHYYRTSSRLYLILCSALAIYIVAVICHVDAYTDLSRLIGDAFGVLHRLIFDLVILYMLRQWTRSMLESTFRPSGKSLEHVEWFVSWLQVVLPVLSTCKILVDGLDDYDVIGFYHAATGALLVGFGLCFAILFAMLYRIWSKMVNTVGMTTQGQVFKREQAFRLLIVVVLAGLAEVRIISTVADVLLYAALAVPGALSGYDLMMENVDQSTIRLEEDEEEQV